MHKAKAFFFVCLGILCLVAAYHFGATSAGAHSGLVAAADCDADYRGFSAVLGRTLYTLRAPGGPFSLGEIPGTSPVVACSYKAGSACALLDNGDCYEIYGVGYSWEYRGNVLAGVVSGQTMSMGQLKAKYATPRPTQ